MGFPALPTDRLFKVFAFLGLFVALSAAYGLFQLRTQWLKDATQMQYILEIQRDLARVHINRAQRGLSKDLKAHLDSEIEAKKGKLNTLAAKGESFDTIWISMYVSSSRAIVYDIVGIIGAAFVGIGFGHWYFHDRKKDLLAAVSEPPRFL